MVVVVACSGSGGCICSSIVACGAVVVVCYLSKYIRMPKRTAASHRSMTVSPYFGAYQCSVLYSKAYAQGYILMYKLTVYTHNPHALPVHKYLHTQYRHSHDTRITIIHTHD